MNGSRGLAVRKSGFWLFGNSLLFPYQYNEDIELGNSEMFFAG